MKPLYIGATLKDCGKTSISLGLMQMLKARGLDAGYCKPVGQHYVRYQEKNIDIICKSNHFILQYSK